MGIHAGTTVWKQLVDETKWRLLLRLITVQELKEGTGIDFDFEPFFVPHCMVAAALRPL
jgi:hypothetical protein